MAHQQTTCLPTHPDSYATRTQIIYLLVYLLIYTVYLSAPISRCQWESPRLHLSLLVDLQTTCCAAASVSRQINSLVNKN